MRRLVRIAVFLIAALPVSMALADDQQIAKDIISTLKEQKDRGKLKGFNIDLQVDKGTVWLKGYVANDGQKKMVLETARGTSGVQEVISALEIKADKTGVAQDAQKKRAIGGLLARARKKPDNQPASEAQDVKQVAFDEPTDEPQSSRRRTSRQQPTPATSRTDDYFKPASQETAVPQEAQIPTPAAPRPTPAKPASASVDPADQALVKKVISALRKKQEACELFDFDIDVKSKNGDVWVSGRVSTTEQHTAVIDTVRYIRGVKQVVNDLKVEKRETEEPIAAAVTPQPEPIATAPAQPRRVEVPQEVPVQIPADIPVPTNLVEKPAELKIDQQVASPVADTRVDEPMPATPPAPRRLHASNLHTTSPAETPAAEPERSIIELKPQPSAFGLPSDDLLGNTDRLKLPNVPTPENVQLEVLKTLGQESDVQASESTSQAAPQSASDRNANDAASQVNAAAVDGDATATTEADAVNDAIGNMLPFTINHRDESVTDKQIAQEIIRQLEHQKKRGLLKNFGIDLNVTSGEVWMKGRVMDLVQQKLALEVVRRVPGVKMVVNDLAIGNATQATPVNNETPATQASHNTSRRTPAAAQPFAQQQVAQTQSTTQSRGLRGFFKKAFTKRQTPPTRQVSRRQSTSSRSVARSSATRKPVTRKPESVASNKRLLPFNLFGRRDRETTEAREGQPQPRTEAIAQANEKRSLASATRGFFSKLVGRKSTNPAPRTTNPAPRNRAAESSEIDLLAANKAAAAKVIEEAKMIEEAKAIEAEAIEASQVAANEVEEAQANTSLVEKIELQVSAQTEVTQAAATEPTEADNPSNAPVAEEIAVAMPADEIEPQPAADNATSTEEIASDSEQVVAVDTELPTAEPVETPAENMFVQAETSLDTPVEQPLAATIPEQPVETAIDAPAIDQPEFEPPVRQEVQAEIPQIVAQPVEAPAVAQRAPAQTAPTQAVPTQPVARIPVHAEASQPTIAVGHNSRPIGTGVASPAAATPIPTFVPAASEADEIGNAETGNAELEPSPQYASQLVANSQPVGTGQAVAQPQVQMIQPGQPTMQDLAQAQAQYAAWMAAQQAVAQQAMLQGHYGYQPQMAPGYMVNMAGYGQPAHFSPVQMYMPAANQMPVPIARSRGFGNAAGGAVALAQAAMPVPSHVPGGGSAMAPIRYDQPTLPGYAWPTYASHPNYAGVTYPKQYSPSAWPYIGPFYPYPQVPLGWRKISLEWDDGWWYLDFWDKNWHR